MTRSWQIERPKNERRLVVHFTGDLTGPEGVESAMAFRLALESLPEATDDAWFDVTWNVTAMTGYDSEARAAWQRVLWPVRSRIRGVTVVGANRVIRFGARVLTIALGVPCSFVDAP